MTGLFVRVERNGRWQNVEIDELTETELDEFAAKLPDKGWYWAKGLIGWIKDNVKSVPVDSLIQPLDGSQ